MMVKRKELQCGLGKVTVEEFHDGYRMHIAVIAERTAPPLVDEYWQAYEAAGISVHPEKREIRFSVSDAVVSELVVKGKLAPNMDVIECLRILAKEAWARRNDLDPVWGHQVYVWNQSANANPFGGDTYSNYEFNFPRDHNGPMPESFE